MDITAKQIVKIAKSIYASMNNGISYLFGNRNDFYLFCRGNYQEIDSIVQQLSYDDINPKHQDGIQVSDQEGEQVIIYQYYRLSNQQKEYIEQIISNYNVVEQDTFESEANEYVKRLKEQDKQFKGYNQKDIQILDNPKLEKQTRDYSIYSGLHGEISGELKQIYKVVLKEYKEIGEYIEEQYIVPMKKQGNKYLVFGVDVNGYSLEQLQEKLKEIILG